jgi:hypothetical protein
MRSDVARNAVRGAVVLAVCGCFLYPPVGDLTGGSPSGDGGVPAADALGGPWCPASSPSSSVFFCRDFDDGGVGEGWEIANDANGSITLDSALWSSPPRSARVDFKGASSDCVYVRLEKSFAPSLTHTRLAFDYYMPSGGLPRVPPSLTYQVAAQSIPSNTRCSLVLQVNGTSAQIMEQTYANPSGAGEVDTFHGFAQPPVFGQWGRMVIDVDYAASTFKVMLRPPGDDGSDGGTVVDEPLSARCSGTVTNLLIAMGFGCLGMGIPGAWINFDNVVFEGH